MNSSLSTKSAYQYCRKLAAQHYENFPVASFLLPAKLRNPIAAIYAFARTADDYADEGNLSATERLQKLEDLSLQLNAIEQQQSMTEPMLIALADTIQTHNLPIQLFQDLLQAFKQDVVKTRYANFAQLITYCRHSANPIGRLLLILNNSATQANLQASDFICTALQLLNFYQDLAQDYQTRQRIYLPQDEMQTYNVTAAELMSGVATANLNQLLKVQLDRAEALLRQGSSLGNNLSGLFGIEIRCIIFAAFAILKKLKSRHDCLVRPKLHFGDYVKFVPKACFNFTWMPRSNRDIQ